MLPLLVVCVLLLLCDVMSRYEQCLQVANPAAGRVWFDTLSISIVAQYVTHPRLLRERVMAVKSFSLDTQDMDVTSHFPIQALLV
jgi:hypothetical protein